MSIFTTILATIVALEFFYIFYLETLATTSASTSRVFKMSQEELSRPTVNTLFKNQGVYNALIAVFVMPDVKWVAILMGYIIAVAIYGGVTSDKGIILKQSGLAILTLISMLF